MKTKTINLYTIDELQEASEKGYNNAIKYFRDTNEYFFMEDCINERLHEILEEKGIIDTNDTSRAGTKPTRVMYSLGYSQGDGCYFEGDFIFSTETEKVNGQWKKYNVKVEKRGLGYSNILTITDIETGEEVEKEEIEEEFNKVYTEICKELERYGYDFMECEDSEENIKGNCEANEYLFTINGELETE